MGALVALACNEIVMSPTSVLGDCAPILLSGDHQLQPMPPTERAKAESPVLADFLESTRKNGYDPLLAEAMVRVDTPLHLLQNDQVRQARRERQGCCEDARRRMEAPAWRG